MPQLILLIMAIGLIWTLFAVFLPAIIGLFIGAIWRHTINSDIERVIVNAESTIRKTINEIEALNKKLELGLKKKEEMQKNQRDIFLQVAISTLSKPTINFMCKLQEKYEIITSKYYLKEFGDNKIDLDMIDSIDGNFPGTLSLSDDFQKEFDALFLQLSKEKPAMENLETRILFN